MTTALLMILASLFSSLVFSLLVFALLSHRRNKK